MGWSWETRSRQGERPHSGLTEQFVDLPLLLFCSGLLTVEADIVAEALSQALDKRNYPLLIHCNKGKARVGVITGLIRRLQGWSHTSIFEEYARFAGTKAVDEEVSEETRAAFTA